MILKCITPGQPSGNEIFRDGSGGRLESVIYPLTENKLYRPFAMTFEPMPNTKLRQLFAVRTDDIVGMQPQFGLLPCDCFRVEDKKIDSNWSMLRIEASMTCIGDPIAEDLEMLYNNICGNDQKALSYFLGVTTP